MSYEVTGGKWVRGYLQSDALNVDAAVPLFDANGNSVTLAKNQVFVLEAAVINAGATSCAITIYSDLNGGGSYNAGEEMVSVILPVNGSIVLLDQPIFGFKSDGANVGKIRAIASAASVGTRINLYGRVIGG